MSGSLRGKIALVTGAGGGIGEAIARALAAAGADVAIHDREMSPALSAEVVEIEQFGRRAVAVTGDVSDENGVAAFVAQAIDRLGPIDILVNNAGVMTEIPLLHMTLEDWRQTLDINLTGYFLCLREVAKHMGPGGPAQSSTCPRNLPTAEASGSFTTAPQRQAFSD